VILNEYPGGYMQNLQEELEYLIRSSLSASLAEKKGGIYLRTSLQVSEEERALLQTVARRCSTVTAGLLAAQMQIDSTPYEPLPARRSHSVHQFHAKPSQPRLDLEFTNGVGGFIDNGRAYQLQIDKGLPPLPWSKSWQAPISGSSSPKAGRHTPGR